MKKIIFYGAIIITICVCLVIEKQEGRLVPSSEVQQTNGSAVTNNSQPSSKAEDAQLPKPMSKQSAQMPILMTNGSPLKKFDSLQTVFNTWSNRIQRPIEFYGKVVDENTQPIAGASISFGCSQFASGQYFETNTISDSDGLFSITGLMGSTLSVHVEKNGYYSVRSNPIQFDYQQILNTASFQPSPNNPVIFHLLEKGVGANLISSALNPKIPLDGTPVYLDFLNRSSGASGQLQLSQHKPPYESWRQATTWSFKMAIPDGGFIEENDEFPFEAPESGYQPVLEFNFQQGQPNWARDIHKNYYFQFGNPPRYGHLTVETDITWGGARITYVVNPDGSRYLEPKN